MCSCFWFFFLCLTLGTVKGKDKIQEAHTGSWQRLQLSKSHWDHRGSLVLYRWSHLWVCNVASCIFFITAAKTRNVFSAKPHQSQLLLSLNQSVFFSVETKDKLFYLLLHSCDDLTLTDCIIEFIFTNFLSILRQIKSFMIGQGTEPKAQKASYKHVEMTESASTCAWMVTGGDRTQGCRNPSACLHACAQKELHHWCMFLPLTVVRSLEIN